MNIFGCAGWENEMEFYSIWSKIGECYGERYCWIVACLYKDSLGKVLFVFCIVLQMCTYVINEKI